MIPAPFEYLAPDTLQEAVTALSDLGEEAKVLAGGHSLLPLMKLRLAVPSSVIDLGAIAELNGIRIDDGWLVIGAMTRYVDLQLSSEIRREAGLLAQAAALVGDAQVRNRGTIGGALAHADPAGDMPAIARVLDATIETLSPRGTRSISADDFFVGIFETALEPDEIITAVRLPRASGRRYHYEKFRRRLCDWAIVGSAVSLSIEGEHISAARLALVNVGPTPARATAVEEALNGRAPTAEVLGEAAALAGANISPTPELNAPPHYKQHLARVITNRALEYAIGTV